MMPVNSESLEDIEFETKYPVEAAALVEFKQTVEKLPGLKSFIYIEGEDQFFSYPASWFRENPQWDPSGTFARYRKPAFGLDKGRRQVTWKYKPTGAKDSIKRKEYNWDIGKTPERTILEQMKAAGMLVDSSLIKSCHIYKFERVTLVFYTTYDTSSGKPGEPNHFIEIEIDENLIKEIDESQAWKIIEEYEKTLEPIGVIAEKRLQLSLFQMNRRKNQV